MADALAITERWDALVKAGAKLPNRKRFASTRARAIELLDAAERDLQERRAAGQGG